jgi:hypothetical protein
VPRATAINENSPASLLDERATARPLEACSRIAACLIGLPSASFTTPVIRYFVATEVFKLDAPGATAAAGMQIAS